MCSTPEQTAREILAYLAKKPDAQDTLEGITQWWLLEQEIEKRALQVESAISDLVARGLVLERKGYDARSHYRVNRRKLREISSIVQH